MFKASQVLAFGIMFLVAFLPSLVKGETPLRIATFNVEWLVKDADETDKDPWGENDRLGEHYERIAGVIEVLNPDIMLLVEVTTKESLDRLVDILREKGLTDYEGYHIESDDTGTGQDICFLSKIAPTAIGGQKIRKFFSADATGEYRESYTWTTAGGATMMDDTSVSKNAVCCFDIGGTKIGFLGLHLLANPTGFKQNAQRGAQAKVAQKIIRKAILDSGYTPVVLGDINDFDPDVPDRDDGSSTVTNVLRTLKDYDSGNAGDELVNVSGLIARKKDRYTAHFDKNDNGDYDDSDPMTMIDHILLHESLMTSVKRVFIDHGHALGTSDHFPVVVDLVLP